MLTGRTAIVTGASRGIGAAIAEKLASQGASVAVICSGHLDTAESVCERCRAFGVRSQAWQCDVSDYAAVQTTVREIRAQLGTVSLLVNNAGITRDAFTPMMKEDDFDKVIAVNLKGAFNLIRHVSGMMIRNHGGRILNISSVAGLTGNAGQGNYAASKAGLIGLTKSVARELASQSITCNAIAPGFIETDMTRAFASSEQVLNAIPLKRMGSPKEVADLAAFLLSDEAGYITGEVIRIDGGIAM